MAKGQNIAQLRSALQRLESYELPDRYMQGAMQGKDGTNSKRPALDERSVRRYRAARDTYVRQRTTELFLQHLSSFDGTTFAFPPPVMTPEAEADLIEREGRAKAELADISRAADERLDMVRARYDALVERREELARTIAEMESDESGDQQLSQGDDDDDDDAMTGGTGDVNDEAMAAQEDRLAGLIERRAELEAKLRRIRADRAVVDADVASNRRAVDELRRRSSAGGGGDSGGAAVDNSGNAGNNDDANDGVDDATKTIEKIEERTDATLRAAADLKDAAEWYDGMREAIEELGGMRILGIESDNGGSNGGSNGGTASPAALIIKFELLYQHVLEVALSSEIVAGRAAKNRRHHRGAAGETLRVVSAKITTPTIVTASSSAAPAASQADTLSNDPSTSSIEVRIRQPDDLVVLAANLPPVDDLRFVVRETQGRIRAAIGRSEELATLRSSYLTRIGPVPKNSEEHHGQEVVCSLPAGVTAVLRLCDDCPLVEGAVYISDIVGVGGWNQSDLNLIKERLNGGAGFASPVALMDALAKEIQRRTTHGMSEDKTIELPKTPTLPTRR